MAIKLSAVDAVLTINDEYRQVLTATPNAESPDAEPVDPTI